MVSFMMLSIDKHKEIVLNKLTSALNNISWCFDPLQDLTESTDDLNEFNDLNHLLYLLEDLEFEIDSIRSNFKDYLKGGEK